MSDAADALARKTGTATGRAHGHDRGRSLKRDRFLEKVRAARKKLAPARLAAPGLR